MSAFAPGSKEAVEHGCVCPVFSNNYGRGLHTEAHSWGLRITYMTESDCPLHGEVVWGARASRRKPVTQKSEEVTQ